MDLEHEPIPFVAISYAWGNPILTEPITCNEEQVLITKNLCSALQRIRDASQQFHSWVDALCINQSSELQPLRERAHQVQMMDRIFAAAMSVVVDLGEELPYYREFRNLAARVNLTTDEAWKGVSQNVTTCGWSQGVSRQPPFSRNSRNSATTPPKLVPSDLFDYHSVSLVLRLHLTAETSAFKRC